MIFSQYRKPNTGFPFVGINIPCGRRKTYQTGHGSLLNEIGKNGRQDEKGGMSLLSQLYTLQSVFYKILSTLLRPHFFSPNSALPDSQHPAEILSVTKYI